MAFKGTLFMSPERVIFGCGVVDDIGTYVKQLGGIKPFIATDKIIFAIDAFQRIEDSLKKDNIDYYLYAISAIKRIFKYLGRAIANGRDMEAREQMLLGAMEAGFAMNTGCALIHSSGLQLTSKFGLSHGETLAIMASPVMRFNTMACVERMIDIAKAMAENVQGLGKLDAAYIAAEAVQKFAQSIEVPTHLNRQKHDPGLIPQMAQTAISNDNTYGNPRIPSQTQLEALYRQAYSDL